MKIVLMGYSGAGKSTAATKLGEALNSPVLHLDSINFHANWVKREKEDVTKDLYDFMQNESWIIDGNYNSVGLDERLKEADYIMILQYNVFTCYYRAYKRYRENKGKVRSNVSAGCEEKFDLEFQKWILFGTRSKKKRLKFKEINNIYPNKTFICKNDKQKFAAMDKILANHS